MKNLVQGVNIYKAILIISLSGLLVLLSNMEAIAQVTNKSDKAQKAVPSPTDQNTKIKSKNPQQAQNIQLEESRRELVESLQIESATTDKTKSVSNHNSEFSKNLAWTLKKITNNEKHLLKLISDELWNEALQSFDKLISANSFIRTADAQALRAYLLFKSGLTINAFESLALIDKPGDISGILIRNLQQEAGSQLVALSLVKSVWKNDWVEYIGSTTDLPVELFVQNASKSILEIVKLNETPEMTPEKKTILAWLLVGKYVDENKIPEAGKMLNQLIQFADSKVLSKDLINLTTGRILFQVGALTPASDFFQKVKRDSIYWLDAQEALAWIYFRKNKLNDVIAVTTALDNPLFAQDIGPEVYFVRTFAQLRLCDYQAVANQIEKFRDRFKVRSLALNKVIKETNVAGEMLNALSNLQLQKLESGKRETNELFMMKISAEDLGKTAKFWPRLIQHDLFLNYYLQRLAVLDFEIKKASSYSKINITRTKDDLEKIRRHELNLAQDRLRELAKRDLLDITKHLNKMHLIEAELMQRLVHFAKSGGKANLTSEEVKGSTGSRARDVLRFPASGDLWMDEVGYFNVEVKKSCEAQSTRKADSNVE